VNDRRRLVIAYSCVLVLVGLALGVRSAAQNRSQFGDWASLADSMPTARPRVDCRTLISLTSYQLSIETATLMAGSTDAPEHCRVTGQILPEVRFEVSLPTAWKGRLYMFGNGGYAGESLTADTRVVTRNTALRQSFAVAQTNTGHDGTVEPLASFAGNRQKLLDYAYRAVHITAETAKELARRYYASEPARSYFDGCSTGGRQGLISAQRFPDDFDGILVGAPVLNLTDTMISYISDLRALAEAPVPEDKQRRRAFRRRKCAPCRPSTAAPTQETGDCSSDGRYSPKSAGQRNSHRRSFSTWHSVNPIRAMTRSNRSTSKPTFPS
jgi:feruloyl esterase